MLTDERVVSWLGGSFTMAGDLTFSGNARRIKGDFDNATIANRLLFQSTSSNQTSSVGVIPNGSGAGGNLAVFSTSDPDNSHITLIGASATTSDVTATKTGTGTTRNLNLNSGTGTVTVEANTGRVIIPGGQISFPATQNASADANTLDDYEEGTVTWSVGGTATYTLRVGHYTKIGRLIHVYGVVVINTIGTGSATNISGIPFTAASEAVMPVSKCSTSVTNIVSISGELIAASSFVQLRSRTAASASDAVNNIFQNGTTVEFGGSYHE
jgi:hypothetical protein